MAENNTNNLKSELRERTLGYVVAAFGIVAGLAWNDAVKALIEYIFPGDKNSLIIVKFGYAIVITGVVVVITTMLMKFVHKEKVEEAKEEKKK
ncbi:MAG: DUF5654 family protein [Patescibacteria group bacterium]|jgi:hypothetical protein